MDGNGRWARARHLPRTAGHKKGVDATRAIVEACAQRGVEVLTLFAFSSENWNRPKSEVASLMELFITVLAREAKRLAKNNIRMKIIGERQRFSAKLQSEMQTAESLTQKSNGMLLQIAVNYGGRLDLLGAVRKIAEKVSQGTMSVADLTEDSISDSLSTAGVVDPDLFIRTGGEKRISNFLLWQLAYSELYFTDQLWPDFNENELDAAIKLYQSRERRFGQTSEQLSS
jgi:undecaprenyl diphosphate synthase